MDAMHLLGAVVIAFGLGLVARTLRLPPLVGFLAAGFVLNATGFDDPPELYVLADLGVILLLFAIGLKLDVRQLIRPAIWGGSLAHMVAMTLAAAAVFLLLGVTAWSMAGDLDPAVCLLIGFALSFSSTVFAVKIQETAGDAAGLHARTAIGFLIMQDLVAVIFLAAAKGQMPSWWALALLPALLVARPLVGMLLSRVGHGELLVLLGLTITAAGYLEFELVGLKGDLGALVVGALIAGHPRSQEMVKSLLSFKDIFLVAFFLTIGFTATPTWNALAMAVLLVALLPLKVAAYFFVLVFCRYRARTATLAALQLASYSEFGLIVAALAAREGWLGGEWLAVIALAVAISFVIAAPLSTHGARLFARLQPFLVRFEREERLPEERPLPIGEHRVVIFGMGGVGSSCYDRLETVYGGEVIGVDVQRPVVVAHRSAGRQCVLGDASDREFWDRCHLEAAELIMLCLPDTGHTIRAAARLRELGFAGHIGAIALYDDEVQRMREAGVDMAFAMYREAGAGLADSVLEGLVQQTEPVTPAGPRDDAADDTDRRASADRGSAN